MYKTLPRKREHLIRDSGNISISNLKSTSKYPRYRNIFTEILYVSKVGDTDLRLFETELVIHDGMLIFQDVTYSEIEDYPLGVVDVLCRMVLAKVERIAREMDFDCVMVSTDVSLFPEAFLERKYDIKPYNFTISRKPGWQGIIEIS